MRISVIGAGRIGRLHSRIIRQHDRAQVACVFDPDPAAAKALATAVGAEVADSAEAAIAAADAVFICSPTDSHVDLSLVAARAGRAVFCEKPLDLSVERAMLVTEALARNPVPFMTGFHRRFDPTTRRVGLHVRGGGIGRPEFMRIVSRDPGPPPVAYIRRSGGIFRDMSIHDLDLCRWLTGQEFSRVFAQGFVLVDEEIGRAGDFDTATITMWNDDGFSVTLQNSRRSGGGFDQRIEIMGATSAVEVANVPVTHARFMRADGLSGDRLPDHFPERYDAAYAAQIDHFITAVETGTPPETSALDGLRALQLADACARSARTGEVVRLHPDDATLQKGTSPGQEVLSG